MPTAVVWRSALVLCAWLLLGCTLAAWSRVYPAAAPGDVPPRDGFAADGTPRWALSGLADELPAKRAYVFVGGLQRSGTTLVEAWLAHAPGATVSFLGKEHMSVEEYETFAPWRMHNHSREYFESVIRTGGLEGKFVQDVMAYRNIFRQMGLHGERAVAELTLSAADVPRDEAVRTAARNRLLMQWGRFWGRAGLNAEAAGDGGARSSGGGAVSMPHYFLEKSPENVLLAPYLRSLLSPLPTHHLFVARHPLIWALATQKWVHGEFVAMRHVAERVRGWLAVMEHMQTTALRPGALPSAVAIAIESFAAHPQLQQQLLAGSFGLGAAAACAVEATAVAVAPGSPGLLTRAPSACAPLPRFIARTYGYVACWLHGGALKLHGEQRVMHCSHDGMDGVVDTERARRRQAVLRSLYAELEPRVNALGYSFVPFLQTRAGLYWRPLEVLDARGPWADALIGVRADAAVSLPAGWLRPPPRPPLPVAEAPRSGGAAQPYGEQQQPTVHLLLAYELPARNLVGAKAHSGMNQRFLQVARALRAIGCALHLVSFQTNTYNATTDQTLPLELRPPAAASYYGSFEEQVSAALLATGPSGLLSHALVFASHITQNLHRHAERDDKRAAAFKKDRLYARAQRMHTRDAAFKKVRVSARAQRVHMEPPPLALSPERAVHWARATLPRIAIAVVTDDIHHRRVLAVVKEHAAVDRKRLGSWLRKREGALYASADITFAVSPEDASDIATGFADGADAVAGRITVGKPVGVKVTKVSAHITAELAAGGAQARAALAWLAAACARDATCVGVRLPGSCVRFRISLHTGGALAVLPAPADAPTLTFAKALESAGGGGGNGAWGGTFDAFRGVRAFGAVNASMATAAEAAVCAGAAPPAGAQPPSRVRIVTAAEGLSACAADAQCAGLTLDADAVAIGLARDSKAGGGCAAVLLRRAPGQPPAAGRLRWSRDARYVTIGRSGGVHARWLPFVLDARAASISATVEAAAARGAWTAKGRRGLFYVGLPHPLSIAAISWLCDKVLPALAPLGTVAHLPVAQTPALALALQRGQVTLLGDLSDDALDTEFRAARVFAAPLVNATGIATKNVAALARGLPIVSGLDGARGLGFDGRAHAARVMRLSDDAYEFAAHCRALITHDALWASYAAEGVAHVRATLSAERLEDVLRDFVRGGTGAEEALEFHRS
ncbi:hypothetical protein T492DRAFT_935037 [Pavlovales sp. CCMP2436]|nr:hypothetical protein T492DRAFT_935037 [Pavlovales sp. CCMP2436]